MGACFRMRLAAPLCSLLHTGCLGVRACVCVSLSACVCARPQQCFCFLPALQSNIGGFSTVCSLFPSLVSILAFSQCALSVAGMNGLHIVAVCVCARVSGMCVRKFHGENIKTELLFFYILTCSRRSRQTTWVKFDKR